MYNSEAKHRGHLLNCYEFGSSIEIKQKPLEDLMETEVGFLGLYQMALAQGLGSENKGAMIKVWKKTLGVLR